MMNKTQNDVAQYNHMGKKENMYLEHNIPFYCSEKL